jgi:hypothetical protein
MVSSWFSMFSRTAPVVVLVRSGSTISLICLRMKICGCGSVNTFLLTRRIYYRKNKLKVFHEELSVLITSLVNIASERGFYSHVVELMKVTANVFSVPCMYSSPFQTNMHKKWCYRNLVANTLSYFSNCMN